MITVTGLFKTPAEAQSAVQELVNSGWPHEDIGLVTGRPSAGGRHDPHALGVKDAEKGAVVGGLAGLFIGLSELAVPGVGPVLVGGWLVTTLLGAGVGAAAGGLVGSLVDAGISHEEAGRLAEGVKAGGTLVTVRSSGDRIADAEEILRRHGAANIEERSAE
jgi:hypothetical protein